MSEDAQFALIVFGLLIFRILMTCWAVDIAHNRNRNAAWCGFWTFIFPVPGVIITALLHKHEVQS